MSGDLINAVEAWKSIGAKMFLRVCMILDPDALNQIFSANSKPTVITVSNAGEKQEHTFVDNVKQILIRCEKVTEIKYAFNEADFDAGKKLTITSGGALKLSSLNFVGTTIYFETDKNNMDVEILELF